MKSYIFRTNFQHRYNSAFQDYVIEKMFGGNILLGSDLVQEDIKVDERNKENEK